MSKRVNPVTLGSFVVVGVLLVLGALFLAGGKSWLDRKQRAVMHFSGSVYGLQAGAPVVFRGVQVGTVQSIDVHWDDGRSVYRIPVVAELDSDALRRLGGGFKNTAEEKRSALQRLLDRGLRAQLGMQSLLTGQLYVDLDLRANNRAVEPLAGDSDLPEIPTQQATIQSLKNQLDGLDLRRLVEDLGATAASVRELSSAPELRQAVTDSAAAVAQLRQLLARLDRQVDPLAGQARQSLGRADRAFDSVDQAAVELKQAAASARTLLDPQSPLVQQLQTGADEVARAATALRQLTDADAPLLQDSQRALQDLSRSARALRQLADTLERQPESLLKGKRDEERR